MHEVKSSDLDSKTFRELAELAGFGQGMQIDTAALAKFYDVNEQTVKRWVKLNVATKPTIKLLKLKVLLIHQENWINHLTDNYQKYAFIEAQLDMLTEQKIRAKLAYPIIRKKMLSMLINLIAWLYTKLDN